MDFEIGVACSQCDTFSPMGTSVCPKCDHDLSLEADDVSVGAGTEVASASQPASEPVTGSAYDREKLMQQAKNYVCTECSTPVPSGHKFCGTCGAEVPPEIVELQTKYFGAMQAPGKARLILIRGGSGVDGLSYMLQGTEHVAGRQDGQILFPDDNWLSPRHATFYYQNDKLVVRDESSINGVYVRVREPRPLELNDYFLCGEQVFRLEGAPDDAADPSADETYFYASPHRPASFRVVQVLAGGAPGMVVCARGNSLRIGREGVDINFPHDVYMSGTHARIEMSDDRTFALVDEGSRNGTYVRIREPHPLQHGDYLFLGKQLLRVEMTA